MTVWIQITCNSDNCEKDFEFEADLDLGEQATWGYDGGSPAIPPSCTPIEDVILCPHCHYDNTDRAVTAAKEYEIEPILDDDNDVDDKEDDE